MEREKLLAQAAERECIRGSSRRETRYDIEDRFRAEQLKLQQEQLDFERKRNDARVFQLKHYVDAIRNSVSKTKYNVTLDLLPFNNKF